MMNLTKLFKKESRRKAADIAGRVALRYCGLFIMPCLLLAVVSMMNKYRGTGPQILRRTLSSEHIDMPDIIGSSPESCRENAIVYLLTSKRNQEKFFKSMDLLYTNYLNNFHNDAHIFLFHTGDMGLDDLNKVESRYDEKLKGVIRLVNLKDSHFWGELPSSVEEDDPMLWRDYRNDLAHSQELSDAMNLRHENRFWSSQIWEYFDQTNRLQGCNYRYIMRLHHNSFLYSPIQYNIFDFIRNNNYQYGFRLCSQERHQKQLFEDFSHEVAEINDDFSCLFYNPFFVADLHFFLSRPVQRLLQFVDEAGYNYRGNISPTIVHSLAVKAYASAKTIFRFIDFTFEQFDDVNNNLEGCNHPSGGFQAGYTDKDGESHVQEWIYLQQKKKSRCSPRVELHNLRFNDLTPEYMHLPVSVAEKVSLPTLILQQ